METIQSRDNLLIKDIKKLKEKKYRNEGCKFLIEGFRFVCEGLESNFEVPLVFISENAKDRWDSFDVHSKLQKETRVYTVTDQVLKSISSTDNPQGIVAVVNNKSISLENKQGFYILVDRVQDPGNMGTIIRTAHAAGALGIIVTKGTVDIYNEKTLRSTMGSIFHIPIIHDDNLSQLNFLRSNGFKLVVSSLDTDNNFFDADLKNKSIIVVGNEGNGVSKELLDLSDIKVKIPMPGGAESLNVSIAASIMMFEVIRQKLS
ncbi:TrmH family RNA methyltransferase [Clostridium magnum]|uniref:23S rRNA (Uridine(2479)-2'-O)-methyltransferase n=1 Tax=Clostridium magnum DSM 2767 TaxID=1121326 RepID=A0A162U975_9CLOT|nr:RNA methyltransferase [Clostridium magnum]KZL93663.1 23S rRNA (uridine(2479)-2'-O)-methyltransferase [Clostridium magnum DSM 2767]SHI93252.1 RNA methyltransferase, TrmH family [Clostridium magnum DSM 2767]